MKQSREDKFIQEFRKAERELREMESRGERSAAYFELRKKVDAVKRAAEYYAEKYQRTYSGEPFDAIGAFESYIRFCELRSSRKRDIAPSVEAWRYYRRCFMRECKR